MFFLQDCFEVERHAVLRAAEPDLRQYRIAEQCLNLPLWRIEVLPHAQPRDASPLWRTFIAGTTDDALDVLLSGEWQGVRVNVVLPAYVTRSTDSIYAICTAIWSCRDHQGREGRQLVTNQGSFIEFPDEINSETTRRTRQLWAPRDTLKDPDLKVSIEGVL